MKKTFLPFLILIIAVLLFGSCEMSSETGQADQETVDSLTSDTERRILENSRMMNSGSSETQRMGNFRWQYVQGPYGDQGIARDVGANAVGDVWFTANYSNRGIWCYNMELESWYWVDGPDSIPENSQGLRIDVNTAGDPWVIYNNPEDEHSVIYEYHEFSEQWRDWGHMDDIGCGFTTDIIGTLYIGHWRIAYEHYAEQWNTMEDGEIYFWRYHPAKPTVMAEQDYVAINYDNQVWFKYYDSEDWQQLGSIKMQDIAAGPAGEIYGIGLDVNSYGGRIYKWDCYGGDWNELYGYATNIDVDRYGNPWVVNKVGHIFRGDGAAAATVTIGENPSFIGGGRISICVGEYTNRDIRNGEIDANEISALMINHSEIQVTVFDQDNFSGASHVFRGPVQYMNLELIGWDNRIRSIIVEDISAHSLTPWELYTYYDVGDEVSYNGSNYRCISYHQSSPGWEPDLPQMWAVWQELQIHLVQQSIFQKEAEETVNKSV